MGVLRWAFGAPGADWIRFAGFFLGIVAFIAGSEFARARFGWSAEINRKLVHVGTGILIFFSPLWFSSPKPLIWMALVFIAINAFGVVSGKLKGMHGTSRKSWGTVYYPLTFLILVPICWNGYRAVLIIAMMILALSDAAAAAVGETLSRPHEYRLGRDKKSVEGSACMFLATWAIIFIALPLLSRMDGVSVSYARAAWIGFAVAVMATVLEALSSGGSDNLTAPLGSAFGLAFLTNPSAPDIRFAIAIGLALLAAVFSNRFRFLTADGSAVAFILAVVILGVGGWVWILPMITFFVLSSLLSKFRRRSKILFDSVFDKTGKRDSAQALANGGAAGAVVILNWFFPDPLWFPVFLGSLAAATADTWGTEIGILSRSRPVSILTWRKVEPGSSGGITFAGTAAALAGSGVIALSGLFILERNWIVPVVVAGFIASLIDSLLGALVQGQYVCPKCGRHTEKRVHCGVETKQISGYRWVTNDAVNATCSIAGAVMVWVFTR
jgi:uncharacterized protein (TIGR00297 family)